MDAVGVSATTPLDSGVAREVGEAHLLVIEANTSSVFPLPALRGIVTIGRAPEVELRVDHSSVSRKHARIVVEPNGIEITDLDSHNGTRVNGAAFRGARTLVDGDVVAVGEVILVVHARRQVVIDQEVLDAASWNRRLAEEVERCAAYQRSLVVMAVHGPATNLALRRIDVIGRSGDDEILALLPESDLAIARALASTLVARSPELRIGIASCPDDATDAENLVLAARAAADAAKPGGCAVATDAARRLVMGERRVVLCHPAMTRVFELLERLANATLPVLVVGETGVGKENAAYAVHHHSARRGKPFVAINCATLHESLVESQLFGHDKGAFTGAVAVRTGVFEEANGGTLFLDEIGELPLMIQAKLLRVLETGRVVRLGETQERTVDVRIVAATNRVLEREIEAGRFRQDLYFRLGAARVHIPPLRERRCDVPILFRDLVADAAKRAGRRAPEVSSATMRALLAYAWPGNVRELKHTADFAIATIEDDRIEPEDLPPTITPSLAPTSPAPPAVASSMRRIADELADLERARMVEALDRTSGVKSRAAALIGMPIRTFNLRVRQYGL
jgi:DNA-binding NtrC family response regulator